MRCLIASLVVIGVFQVSPATVRGQRPMERRKAPVEQLLEVLPADVYGFALVNRPTRTQEKINSLLERVHLAEVREALRQFRKMTADVKGLNRDGSLAVVMMAPRPAGEDPKKAPSDAKGTIRMKVGGPGLLLVPVSDYEAFLDNFEGRKKEGEIVRVQVRPLPGGGAPEGKDRPESVGALVTRKGDFAVMADPEDRAALERFRKAGGGPKEKLQARTDFLARQDVAVVFLRPSVEGILDWGLAWFGGKPGAGEGKDDSVVTQLLSKTRDNVESVVSGLRLDEKNNLYYVQRTYLVKGDQWAEGLRGVEKPDGHLLGGLAKGPYLAAGEVQLPQPVEKELFRMAGTALSQAGGLAHGAEELRELDVAGMTFLVTPTEEAGRVAVSGTLRAADAEKVMARTAKWLERFGEAARRGEEEEGSELVRVERKERKVGGRPGIEVVTTYRRGKGDEAGTWTAHALMVALDEGTLAYACAVDRAEAEGLVRRYQGEEGSLAEDPAVRHTATLLPGRPHLLAFIDPRQIVRLFQGGAAVKEEGEVAGAGGFPGTPPVGYALTFTGDSIEESLVVPAQVIHGLTRAFGHAGPREERRPEK